MARSSFAYSMAMAIAALPDVGKWPANQTSLRSHSVDCGKFGHHQAHDLYGQDSKTMIFQKRSCSTMLGGVAI
jgi:hypothetical protein